MTPPNAPTSHFVDVNGLRLHYREQGSGPAVLLLHGWPTSSFLWRNVMPHIAASNRVIALDLPGFGQSDKPLDASYSFPFYERVLTGFLDAIDVQDVGLAVHDLGGPLGLWWAIENRDRLRSLALLNTLIYARPSMMLIAFMGASYVPGLSSLFTTPWGLAQTMGFGTCRRPIDGDVIRAVQEPFQDAASRKALIKTLHGLHPKGMARIGRELATLEVPVRVVYGKKDRVLPDVARTMKHVVRDLPDTEVTVLPDCGHFLQEDDPDAVGAALAAFFSADGG